MTKHSLLIILICGFLVQCTQTTQNEKSNEKSNNYPAILVNETKKDRQLVWSDEFDEDGMPDEAKWSYNIGDGCPRVCGWGNNELQYYTANRSENARVENGHLIIEALKEEYENSHYTSARLVSKHKGDWKYGKIEIRAKLPSGRGTWPAIWMLPTNNSYGNWPKSGEIDIMEHVGYEPNMIYGTIHTESYNHMKGTHKNGEVLDETVEEAFHVYAIIWTENKIEFYKDDKKYFTFNNDKETTDEWPFDQPFHLILNIAVGGNWGGKKGLDADIFPQKMEIDYVRVYQ